MRYRFFDKPPRDVTLVAFPDAGNPDRRSGYEHLVPTGDPVNILAFETRVEGKPVAAEVEQR